MSDFCQEILHELTDNIQGRPFYEETIKTYAAKITCTTISILTLLSEQAFKKCTEFETDCKKSDTNLDRICMT